MGPRLLPPNLSQDLMFQNSSESDKAIQSYSSTNEGYQNRVFIVGRVNVL
jgi:hypothetical protein